ncbi:MAG: carboxymuconolactone decarboxylase family protein [Croceibacterium sp.]
MQGATARMMSRIPYPDQATLPDHVRQMIARTPLNIVRMAAHASPALFEAQGALSYAIARPDVLDPKVRETVILVVASVTESAYELHQHVPLARAAGLSDRDICAIRGGNYDQLDSLLGVIAEFAAATVRDPSPPDALIASMRRQVSDQILVNIVLTIGCYMAVARLIGVAGIAVDDNQLAALPTGLPE